MNNEVRIAAIASPSDQMNAIKRTNVKDMTVGQHARSARALFVVIIPVKVEQTPHGNISKIYGWIHGLTP